MLSLTEPNPSSLSPSLFLYFVFAFARQYLPATCADLGGAVYMTTLIHLTRATSAAMFLL